MNKNTQISTTQLAGIVVNTEADQPDGTCQHIVNLRNKHGEWRTVGDKEAVDADMISLPAWLHNTDFVHKVMIHPALGAGYRLVAWRSNAYMADKITVHKLAENGSWSVHQTIWEGTSDEVTFEDMQVFGRWLLVNVTTSEGVIYYVLNEESKLFVKVDNPALAYCLLSPTDYSDLKRNVAASDPNTDGREAHMGAYYSDLKSEMANNNRGRGGLFARLAFQSGDKDVWVGPVMYTQLGMCRADESGFTAANKTRIYNRDSIYSTYDGAKWTIERYRFTGVSLIYKFDSMAAVQSMLDNNLAVKMVLYISRLYDLKDYVVQSFTYREGTSAPKVYDYALCNDQKQPVDTIDSYSGMLYEAYSINVKELAALGTSEQNIRISLKDIQEISTERQMIIEEHTWDRYRGDHVLDYNARLHLSNVSRYFNFAHVHPLMRSQEIDLIKTHWQKTYYHEGSGDYNWENIVPYEWSSSSLNLMTQLNGVYKINMHVVIEHDQRMFVVKKDITTYTTVFVGGKDVTTRELCLYVNPALFLPNLYTKEVYITMQRISDNEERVLLFSGIRGLRKAISTPDKYLCDNFMTYTLYSQNTLRPIRVVLPTTYVSPGGYIDVTFTTLSLFAPYIANIQEGHSTDTNRLQVSSQENPLLFPARHSYRFGTVANRLIASMAAAAPMSDGQFGQFPLYVFTSMGVYALEQGNATLLYSNSSNLNQEVAISKDLIIPVESAVFFVTAQGMKAMVGAKAEWVGQALDGPFASLLDSSVYFNNIIKDTWLSDIENVIIANNRFADQLASSQIAYDHQEGEIIIQISGKQFVYCINTQVWVERSDDFQFLYPAWPGYEFAKQRVILDNIHLELFNPHREVESSEMPVYFETNRIVTDYKAIKAFSNMLINCDLKLLDNRTVGLYVFGSEDDLDYKLLAGREEVGRTKRIKIGHISAGLRSVILILSGSVQALSTVKQIITEYVPRYQSHIR